MLDITPKFLILTAEQEVVTPETFGQGPMGNVVGGWQAGSGQLSQGKVALQATSERILIGDATAPLTGVGIFIGWDGEATKGYDFRVGDPSGNYMHWDASAGSLVVAGAIVASTIDIGGSDATSFHVDADGNMWLGASTFAAAPAKISNAGAATFSNVTVTGGSISGVPISSIPNDTNTDISLLSLSHNLAFSSTDSNTVAWASGTITLSNGRTFSISSGNTGNMGALTFIYLDPGVSSTALQTTTTFSTAIGANKQLIAIAAVAASGNSASFQVLGGRGGVTLDPDNILTATLSAIVANLGTITAGTVTGATIRTASSGTRFQMTSTSFQGINSSGTVIFEIILSGADAGDVIFGDDASGKYAKWDDSAGTFEVFADNIGTPDVEEFSASGTWTKPSGLTYAVVRAWGGGGSGASSTDHGGSGGGGGCYMERTFQASELGSSETVTIGDGGAAAGNGAHGNAGGNTTFGSLLTAYGGGRGIICVNDVGDEPVSGGEGGTPFAAGQSGAESGSPESTPAMAIYGLRAVGAVGGAGYLSGAGGGATSSSAFGGGNAVKGGAGGGGAHNGGTEGAGGTSIDGGNGGAGQDDTNGTAGSVKGGGGGACSSGGNSGAGGKGYLEVWHYYD